MAGEWIEHDGSGCPVPAGTRVDLRWLDPITGLVDEDFNKEALAEGGDSWFWREGEVVEWGDGFYLEHIVAYRTSGNDDARRERYTTIFKDMIKTAPLDLPVQPEKERV